MGVGVGVPLRLSSLLLAWTCKLCAINDVGGKLCMVTLFAIVVSGKGDGRAPPRASVCRPPPAGASRTVRAPCVWHANSHCLHAMTLSRLPWTTIRTLLGLSPDVWLGPRREKHGVVLLERLRRGTRQACPCMDKCRRAWWGF